MRFLWSAEFEKRYKKLPKKIQDSVKRRFALFSQDEFEVSLNNHKLSGEFSAYRSINITGDYRAIYKKIDPEAIYWIAIGTHSQLYR